MDPQVVSGVLMLSVRSCEYVGECHLGGGLGGRQGWLGETLARPQEVRAVRAAWSVLCAERGQWRAEPAWPPPASAPFGSRIPLSVPVLTVLFIKCLISHHRKFSQSLLGILCSLGLLSPERRPGGQLCAQALKSTQPLL